MVELIKELKEEIIEVLPSCWVLVCSRLVRLT